MQTRDYFERLTQQIAGAIARMLGLVEQVNLVKAEQELDAAYATLGLRRIDMSRLDESTVRMLVGEKAPLVAKLYDAEAAIEDARGHHDEADVLRKRAARLKT